MIKVKHLVKYLTTMHKPEEELYFHDDELDDYLPFDEFTLGCLFATKNELKERKRVKEWEPYFERTEESKKKFKEWVKINLEGDDIK